MFVCKEQINHKRKLLHITLYTKPMKKRRFMYTFLNKRKKIELYKDRSVKKQKVTHCLLHEEKYICQIYECSGAKKIYEYTHMPYII